MMQWGYTNTDMRKYQARIRPSLERITRGFFTVQKQWWYNTVNIWTCCKERPTQRHELNRLEIVGTHFAEQSHSQAQLINVVPALNRK